MVRLFCPHPQTCLFLAAFPFPSDRSGFPTPRAVNNTDEDTLQIADAFHGSSVPRGNADRGPRWAEGRVEGEYHCRGFFASAKGALPPPPADRPWADQTEYSMYIFSLRVPSVPPCRWARRHISDTCGAVRQGGGVGITLPWNLASARPCGLPKATGHRVKGWLMGTTYFSIPWSPLRCKN